MPAALGPVEILSKDRAAWIGRASRLAHPTYVPGNGDWSGRRKSHPEGPKRPQIRRLEGMSRSEQTPTKLPEPIHLCVDLRIRHGQVFNDVLDGFLHRDIWQTTTAMRLLVD
jgi:hypothetical protein